MAKRDYYEVLGVSKSATADEIKRAYRKLAMQHHPDKHGGDDKPFKEIAEAYEVLKDSKKRQQYDQFGHNGPFGGGSSGGQGFGGFDFNNANFDFSQFGGGFGDIFDMFMGGAGTQTRGRQSRRGADMEARVVLEFNEAIFGVQRELNFNADERCDRCDGKRAEPGTKIKTCSTCKGAGHVTRMQQTILGSIRQTAVCGTCEGTGDVPEEPCHRCRGKGVVRAAQKLTVKIPAGIDDGSTIRLAGRGGADRSGPSGDLYVHISVKAHPQLRRRGQDIESIVSVPMADAALGGEVPVLTVDGEVQLKVPAGTQSGKIFKLSEKGVPVISGRRRGDHLVTVAVEIPTKLTSRQKELLEEFAAEGAKKKRFW